VIVIARHDAVFFFDESFPSGSGNREDDCRMIVKTKNGVCFVLICFFWGLKKQNKK